LNSTFRFKPAELTPEQAEGHEFLGGQYQGDAGRRIFGKRTLQDVQNKTYEKLNKQLKRDGFIMSHTDEEGFNVYVKQEGRKAVAA
jgi:hypothetical protein